MAMILRIYARSGAPLATKPSLRLESAGATIGRSEDNDLVLEDPDKAISRRHARIEYRNGDFYYVDMGSNPSLINDLSLGKGNEAKLGYGDRILLGGYLLEAAPDPAEREKGASPAGPQRSGAAVFVSPPGAERTLDNLADASILFRGRLGDQGDAADALGLNPSPARSASGRGAESDHVPPERQALYSGSARTGSPLLPIPENYDPLGEPPPTESVSGNRPGMALRPGDNEVLSDLLRGMGLVDLRTTLKPGETAELAGAMLREAIRGTMAVLAARAATKRETRVNMTMLASKANNPLKFFPDPESALKQMLTNELPGYMSAQKAIGVAFDDLKMHEFAVIAGMRSALLAVLERFNPVQIEASLKADGVLDSILPANRKAKLWGHLVELYATVLSEADNDFHHLFGERFAAAYEEQIQRLSARHEPRQGNENTKGKHVRE